MPHNCLLKISIKDHRIQISFMGKFRHVNDDSDEKGDVHFVAFVYYIKVDFTLHSLLRVVSVSS